MRIKSVKIILDNGGSLRYSITDFLSIVTDIVEDSYAVYIKTKCNCPALPYYHTVWEMYSKNYYKIEVEYFDTCISGN